MGKLPDALFQTVTIMVDPIAPKEFVFCGPTCARDWLVYEYVPPVAPPRGEVQKADCIPVKDLPPEMQQRALQEIQKANETYHSDCPTALVQADGDPGDVHGA